MKKGAKVLEENELENSNQDYNNTPKISEKAKNTIEWIICIIIAIVLTFLCRYFIFTPTVVQQVSMYPTLVENQRLMISRTFRITGKMPERGDIVTFEATTYGYSEGTADQSNPVAIYLDEDRNVFDSFLYNVLEITKRSYIKRVIALPGEHVEIKNGKVFINGRQLKEEYLQPDVVTESSVFNDFIVPDGYLFCMGDNRTKSTDCRKFGCVPYDKLEGIVACRFWPLDKFGSVD